MGFTITGNETLLFITTDGSKFEFIGRNKLRHCQSFIDIS